MKSITTLTVLSYVSFALLVSSSPIPSPEDLVERTGTNAGPVHYVVRGVSPSEGNDLFKRVPPAAIPGHHGGEGKRSETEDLSKRVPPAAIPGHHGGEGAKKRSELDDLTLLARGGGGAAQHHCRTKKKCKLSSKAYWDFESRTCKCPPTAVPGPGEGPVARDISIEERDMDVQLEERDMDAQLEERKVCAPLKCQTGYHATYAKGERHCRCVPNNEAVAKHRTGFSGPKFLLEKRTSCAALHCAKNHHAVYVDGKGNCRCVPNSVRGGKREVEDGFIELEKRGYTKASCAEKTCPPFTKPVWNSKDRKCLCAAIP